MALERDGVEYYNSGAWVDSRCTYITIGRDGVAIDEYIPRRPERPDSNEPAAAPTSEPEELLLPAV